MKIFLNRGFVTKHRAVVSVFDHGFLYGDGIFETLRAYRGTLFRLDDHLARLALSAQGVNMVLPHTPAAFGRLLKKSLTVNRLQNGVLRLSVSRGPGPTGLNPSFRSRPTVVIIPRRFSGPPPRQIRTGISVSIVPTRKIPRDCLDPGIKSTNYLNPIIARMQARRNKAEEAVLLTTRGYLAEGSVSNIFIVKNGMLLTPGLDLGILRGVTRQVVLELAREEGIEVREGRLRPADLYKADECFLTSSSFEVMPVVRADRFKIGRGKPGPITLFLQQAFKRRVLEECPPRRE